MDLQTEKIALAKRLLETDDASLLQEVKDVFENHDHDFWNDLPVHVQEGIKESRKQAEQGLLIGHEEIKKKYQKYL